MFYSEDEATNFNPNIVNTDDFKSFKYKAKSRGKTEADGANGMLRNRTIAVSLMYPSNFWRSSEIPLINCKVELKLNWTKCCVLAIADNDNDYANSNIIISTTKDTKLYLPVVTLSVKGNTKIIKNSEQRF